MLCVGCASSTAKKDETPAVAAPPVAIKAIDALGPHNKLRASAGVGALGWSGDLAKQAQKVADEAAVNGCKLRPQKSRHIMVNKIARPPVSGQELVDRWGKTDRLRGILVGSKLEAVGCGVAPCADEYQVWVCYYTAPSHKGTAPEPEVDEPLPVDAVPLNALAAQNALRKSHGVPPLTWSDPLVAEARKLATGSAKAGCEVDGGAKPKYTTLSKKAAPAITAKELIKRWAGSKPALERLVKKAFTKMGCAQDLCADKRQIWVCLYE